LSDNGLIQAVKCRDRLLASLLYEHLRGVVDQALLRVLGIRDHDHDDLMQTAFEQIVVTLCRDSFARGCNLRTWAASIASHVALAALRSRRRERRVIERGISAEAESASARFGEENATSATIELSRVIRHLREMKPAQSEAVFLHDALGHRLTEVASITRVSMSAATSRLVRGRRELHRRLDSQRGGE
jgi:RNA polymerase sigma-70 factor (ECF subfamily)